MPHQAYPLENNFTYHPPIEDQAARYEQLRKAAKSLAALYLDLVPESRERAVALTKLEEASMWQTRGLRATKGSR